MHLFQPSIIRLREICLKLPFYFYSIGFTEFMAAQVGDPMQVPWCNSAVRGRGKCTRTLLVLDQKTNCKVFCPNNRPALAAQFSAEASPSAPNAIGADRISQAVAHQVSRQPTESVQTLLSRGEARAAKGIFTCQRCQRRREDQSEGVPV